jgi:hypothetical protein
MSQTIALGHYLVLVAPSGEHFRFQNFHIGETGSYQMHSDYHFLPFGFSGVTVSRQGDNVESQLVLPNNELSRPWAVRAIQESWVARVRTMRLNPDNLKDVYLLYPFVGQVAAGGWDDTALTLKLNTVIDAVGADVPHRALTEDMCGMLPVTANVRL